MTYPNPLNVTLRNLKTFNGLEGQGFSAFMYVGGLLTAGVIDDANGGCYTLHIGHKAGKPVEGADARLKQVEAFIKTLPETPWPEDFGASDSTGYAVDLDDYLSQIVDHMETKKKLARVRKTKLLFRLSTDRAEEYRTLGTLDVVRATAQLNKNHGAGKWVFV